MYGAIKKAIRVLSCSPAAPKCPVSYLEADDTELQVYVAALFELITLDAKKIMPKKWWGLEVVTMLLMLHLQHSSQFGNCKSANHGCYLQTNNLETLSYLLPDSMEDYAAYPESPFEPCLNEQENNQDITSIQDRSPEIHTTQKDVLITTESPTKNLVEENVLQLRV
jgi:hypothetical protein